MTKHNLDKVPGREHYSLEYLGNGRVFSYAHQIASVLAFSPKSVVEVGVGGGMVTAALRSYGVNVTTVDVQPELKPDVIASVQDLPFSEAHFDVGICCQVLEHLPMNSFLPALAELRRVCRVGAIISLPDISRHLSLAWSLPFLGSSSWSVSLPQKTSERFREQRLESMGHHWEIGFPGSSHPQVLKRMREAGWSVERTWRVPEMHWHRFYILTPLCLAKQSGK